MRKGFIALAIVLLIGVLTIYLYQRSLQPKYPGVWTLVEGGETCFDEIEFSPGPRDYKGTVLRMKKEKEEAIYLAGHYQEKGEIIVEVFNYADIPLIHMQDEKQGDHLHLTYEWEQQTNSCLYENVTDEES